MNQPLLELESISYTAGDFRLSDISLSLCPGEYRCVVGPTGSGKTVLLELIAGIRKPDRGHIRFLGADITASPPEERYFGFSYQDSLLFPFLSIRDNILFGLSGGRKAAERLIKQEMADRFAYIAEQMQITHLLDRNPRNLSGGERQRVALARAIIIEPRVLLLDEPLSALDSGTSAEIRQLLRSVTSARNIAVIHVTHNSAEVEELADHVTKINAGCLEYHR